MNIVEAKPMMLLPPRKDLCQECGTSHKPEQPHDACSMFYLVKFKMDHEREATWEDAMSHCEESVKNAWRELLKEKFEVDTKSTNIFGNTR